MATLLDFIHLLSLGVWVGGLLLLFLVVTPTIFQVLSDDLARTLALHVQRSFSSVALTCALGALGSLLGQAALQGGEAWLGVRLGLLAAMLGLTLYGTWVLQPQMDKMLHAAAEFDPREETDPQTRRLIRTQKLAWQSEGTVLLLGLIALWLSVGGPRL